MDEFTAVLGGLLPNARLLEGKATFFSDLRIFSDNGSGPRKVVKHLLPGQEVDVCRLERLSDVTDFFVDQLRSLGVFVPPMDLKIHEGKLFMVMDYAGPDMNRYLMKKGADGKAAIRAIVNMLNGVLLQDQSNPLVGMDLQLANFGSLGFAQYGQVSYLDPFPPLVLMGGTYWVHFPQPSTEVGIQEELDRKFRAFGMLRRFRADLMRLDPDFTCLLNHAVVETLGGQLAQPIIHQFNELPDEKIWRWPRGQAVDFIMSLTITDKDTLRELAARLYPMDRNRVQNMQRVFCLSRADASPGYERPHDERVEMLKSRLISLLPQD